MVVVIISLTISGDGELSRGNKSIVLSVHGKSKQHLLPTIPTQTLSRITHSRGSKWTPPEQISKFKNRPTRNLALLPIVGAQALSIHSESHSTHLRNHQPVRQQTCPVTIVTLPIRAEPGHRVDAAAMQAGHTALPQDLTRVSPTDVMATLHVGGACLPNSSRIASFVPYTGLPVFGTPSPEHKVRQCLLHMIELLSIIASL